MIRIFRSRCFFSFLFTLFVFASASAQFTVNAGPNRTICPGDTAHMGGYPTASGGLAPYTYSWSPSSGLNLPNAPNPIASPSDYITYTLTVTDDTGAVKTNTVTVGLSYIHYVNAGIDTSICTEGFAVIGGSNNVTWAGVNYSWSPSLGLNDSTIGHPTADPDQTTVYTLTASIEGCLPKTTFTTLTVIPPPAINAGDDVTIQEGQNVTLHASGAAYYWWGPQNTLTYYYNADPDAEPVVTTTYYVIGADATKKCTALDSITVFVEPGNTVVFYNTFTPNNDGNNDYWYIGNIFKYPNNRLKIYSRNGKLIYESDNYLNNWDGTAFGEDLPSATYFYFMDLGDGAGDFHGTVTIVR